MKKTLLTILFLLVITLSACSPATETLAEENNVDVNEEEKTVAADTNNNGIADVEVDVVDEDTTEVTLDFDDIQDEETKEAVAKAVGNEDYCQAGGVYSYESEDGSVDAQIIGLTTYKGSEFCEAHAVTEIESPVGTITSETTYYFDNTYKEFWIVTTTSGGALPTPQTNEVHLIDGKVA